MKEKFLVKEKTTKRQNDKTTKRQNDITTKRQNDKQAGFWGRLWIGKLTVATFFFQISQHSVTSAVTRSYGK